MVNIEGSQGYPSTEPDQELGNRNKNAAEVTFFKVSTSPKFSVSV